MFYDNSGGAREALADGMVLHRCHRVMCRGSARSTSRTFLRVPSAFGFCFFIRLPVKPDGTLCSFEFALN